MTQENTDPVIPIRIVIGVTGHRKLDNQSALIPHIQEVIEQIRNSLPLLKHTPIVFTVLSPLAEGADRLVASEILKLKDSQLEAVLPFAKEEYTKDFPSPSSQTEFNEFLAQAKKTTTFPLEGSRKDGYSRAGQYVVDNCDILIALWDGEESEGQGGTAEIVQYARISQCPLYWINTKEKNETVYVYEAGIGLNHKAYAHLDSYNSEKITTIQIQMEAQQYQESLKNASPSPRFTAERLNWINYKLMHRFSRTDLLAEKYQKLYFKAGSLTYILAAIAVTAVTFQVLFLPQWYRLAWIEVFCIFAILGIYAIGKYQKWHTKWIDYRFLAERFRSSLFLGVAGMNVTALRPPRHLSLSYSAQDWMVTAFSSVWSQLSPMKTLQPQEIEDLKTFLTSSWVEEQIRYHSHAHQRHQRRHLRLLFAGNTLFALTLLVALLHVFHVGTELVSHVFAFLAIMFPSIAAALGAIRTHREYLRNSKRSQEMVRHLGELKDKIDTTQSIEQFYQTVREIEETMLHENEDWRVVVRFHELEPAA